jgi:hypothetical protein
MTNVETDFNSRESDIGTWFRNSFLELIAENQFAKRGVAWASHEPGFDATLHFCRQGLGQILLEKFFVKF